MAYSIVITEKGGKPRSESFDAAEITIGRVQDNDIVLPKGNISKRHSRIVLRDSRFIIVDLRSTNGTFVNGKRISAPQVLKDADKIYIGDFTLQLESPKGVDKSSAAAERPRNGAQEEEPNNSVGDGPLFDASHEGEGKPDVGEAEDMISAQQSLEIEAKAAPPPPQAEVAAVGRSRQAPPPAKEARGEPAEKPAPVKRSQPLPLPRETRRVDALHVELPPQSALQARAAAFASVAKNVPVNEAGLPVDDEATLERVRAAAEKLMQMQHKRLTGVLSDTWPAQIAKEVCGLGPLAGLLEDQTVVELFINGPHQILVRRAPETSSIGIPLTPVQAFFSSDDAVALVVRRIMHAAGLKFDADHPIAECRMADGTRVNAVHHAASVNGPLVTMSRSSTRNARLEELVGEGMMSQGMAEFLRVCVAARRNICVAGGPGTGTGTVLSALSAEIAEDERIVVVEQVARLKLPQQHVITLEPRAQKAGPSAATMRDLVGNALRMRPERLVVHEVSGGEALELVMAMAGRQDGTLFTTYASSARDCLDRVETMVRMAGLDVQSRVVREQLSASMDVIVCMTRFADGTSRVTQLAEVSGIEVDLVKTQDIFTFKRERIDDAGRVQGRFMPLGTVPRFYEELQRRGDQVDLAIFRE